MRFPTRTGVVVPKNETLHGSRSRWRIRKQRGRSSRRLREDLTQVAVARSEASVSLCQFSGDQAGRNRNTERCAFPRRPEVAPKPAVPRIRGKSVVSLGPYDNFANGPNVRQIKDGPSAFHWTAPGPPSVSGSFRGNEFLRGQRDGGL
jgi:hypothetical protein